MIADNRKETISFLNKTFNLKIKRLSKGVPFSPWNCTIANTLRRHFDDRLTYILVDRNYIRIGKNIYECPENVRLFITNFDNGKYPELEE